MTEEMKNTEVTTETKEEKALPLLTLLVLKLLLR